jgi:hypothetical protein
MYASFFWGFRCVIDIGGHFLLVIQLLSRKISILDCAWLDKTRSGLESASWEFVFAKLGLLNYDKPCLKPDWMFYQIKENPCTKTKVLSHFKKMLEPRRNVLLKS